MVPAGAKVDQNSRSAGVVERKGILQPNARTRTRAGLEAKARAGLEVRAKEDCLKEEKDKDNLREEEKVQQEDPKVLFVGSAESRVTRPKTAGAGVYMDLKRRLNNRPTIMKKSTPMSLSRSTR